MTIQAHDTLETVDAKLAHQQERRTALARQQHEKAAEAETLRGQLSALLENFAGDDADADKERAALSARISALLVEREAMTPVIAKLDAEGATLMRQRHTLAAERAADAHEKAIADARAACPPIFEAVRTFVTDTLPPLLAAAAERRSALVRAARASKAAADLAGVSPRHTLEHINLTDSLPLNVGMMLRQLLELADTYRQQTEYFARVQAQRAGQDAAARLAASYAA